MQGRNRKDLPSLMVPRVDAERRIKDRIKEGEEFLSREFCVSGDRDLLCEDFQRWHEYNNTLLRTLFDSSSAYSEYIPTFFSLTFFQGEYLFEQHDRINKDVKERINCLRSILERLALFPEPADATHSDNLPEITGPLSKDIFIVHGHDEAVKQEVARFLEHLGLNPIILHEKPDEGRTVIEKIEEHADVAFAVVLLTPDDVGKSKKELELKDRARQNVVLELGYFYGKLGRKRVCAIYTSNLERPSDVHGILYTPFEGNWQVKLAKEIKAAGVEADWDKIVDA